MLDTDDTLVMVHEDSQVPYSDVTVPASPPSGSLPVKRQLFQDDEPVDLCMPAPKRMVARPLAKLKHMLAESAEAMRASRPSSSAGKSRSCTDSSDSSRGPSNSPSIGSIDEGNPGFITRREQLKLQPKARAKVRAGDRAPATGKPKSKAKDKVLEDAEPEPKELAKDDVAEATAKPKRLSKKRKCATEAATEPMPKAAKAALEGDHAVAEDACPAGRARRKTLHSKPVKNMTVNDIMPLLIEDDLKMRIVIDFVKAMDKPAIDKREELPDYKYWQLSTYWTRPSVGVIRKVGDERPVYVGTLTSGGWPTVNVAVSAVDHFATGPFQVMIGFIYTEFCVLHICFGPLHTKTKHGSFGSLKS